MFTKQLGGVTLQYYQLTNDLKSGHLKTTATRLQRSLWSFPLTDRCFQFRLYIGMSMLTKKKLIGQSISNCINFLTGYKATGTRSSLVVFAQSHVLL